MLKNFFAEIDTAGGSQSICFTIIVMGIAVHIFYPDDALVHDIVLGASAVLFAAMKGNNGGKMTLTPKPEPGAVTKTEASTATVTTATAEPDK